MRNYLQIIPQIKKGDNTKKSEQSEINSDFSPIKNQVKHETNAKVKKSMAKYTKTTKRKVKSQKSSKKAKTKLTSISTKNIKSVATRSTPTKISIEIEFYDPRVSIPALSEHSETINRGLLKSAKELLQNFE